MRITARLSITAYGLFFIVVLFLSVLLVVLSLKFHIAKAPGLPEYDTTHPLKVRMNKLYLHNRHYIPEQRAYILSGDTVVILYLNK